MQFGHRHNPLLAQCLPSRSVRIRLQYRAPSSSAEVRACESVGSAEEAPEDEAMVVLKSNQPQLP